MFKLTKLLIGIYLVFYCFFYSLSALAHDYNEAVVGHVIQQEVQGNSVDSSVFEAEMQRVGHRYSLEMISVLQKYLPSMLDSISAELRAKADKNYKCALQSDEYKNKECK
tara:strand:+ start:70 stop:399 length:330 start_codon:yes stop_codon:yes gene_type:complete